MEPEGGSVVIVGAGQAGAWVAITLRSLAAQRPILLVGEEGRPPYERPPLSKGVLSGKSSIEGAYIRPPSFYGENDIELALGQRVVGIERERQAVVFADGSRRPYGTLVLATGSRPRPLPVAGAELPQVHMLRTVADADRLRPHLAAGQRVVAIGAGFIGLEFAAVAREAGCAVTVIEAAPQPLGRVVDPTVGMAIAAEHEQRGVSFRLATGVEAIVPVEGYVEVRTTAGESLPADVVVIGIGAVANTDLARAAGLACDNGVVVDAFGRTSDPQIFAVGDVTRHFNPLLSRSLRLESWQNAQNQGIAIGRVIAGAGEPYAELPWFWTDQYENNFQIIGAPAGWDRVVWRGAPESGKFTVVYLEGGRVVAGNTMNNARDIRFLKQLIMSGRPVDPAAIGDPQFSLAQFAKGEESHAR